MQSAEREILSLLGGVNTAVSFAVAIVVLVLGLVIVRPLNKVAGIAFAGAGGGRILGLGIDAIVDALQPKDGELNTVLIFSVIGTVIGMITSIIFYGGVMFGSVKLADTQKQTQPQPQRGAW